MHLDYHFTVKNRYGKSWRYLAYARTNINVAQVYQVIHHDPE